MIDAGGLYASKDFVTEDGRRVTTGFGHCPGSAGGMVLPWANQNLGVESFTAPGKE